MLRGIRTASANWLGRIVMGVVLGLIAISFAIWGIGDIFRGFGRSSLARIGGTEITIEQFRQLYSERLQQLGRQLGRPITLGSGPRRWASTSSWSAQLIGEATLDERVKALRLGISDAEIVAPDHRPIPTSRARPASSTAQRFEMMLRNRPDHRAALRRRAAPRDPAAATGRHRSLSGTQLPKAAIEAADRYQNEQRTIEYVLLDRAQAGEIPDADARGSSRNISRSARRCSARPSTARSSSCRCCPASRRCGSRSPTPTLQKAYEERRARYLTPERRDAAADRVRQSGGGAGGGRAHRQGRDVPRRSPRNASSPKRTSISALLTKAAIIDQAVADAAFALKEDEVSAPVKGRFGTVLVRVVKIEPEQVRPFEEVARRAPQASSPTSAPRPRSCRSTTRSRTSARSAGRWRRPPPTSSSPARTIEVDRQGVDPSGKPVTDIPDAQRLLTPAFTADVGVENDPLQVEGGYVWYEVAGITPARERTLDEVKDEVEARWRDDEVANRCAPRRPSCSTSSRPARRSPRSPRPTA